MNRRINEVGGYDDPTHKKISQTELGLGIVDSLRQMVGGMTKLEEIILGMATESELKEKLIKSAQIIYDEINAINQTTEDFGLQVGKQPTTKEDSLRYGIKFDPNGPIMNESLHGKIEQTINRIKEVNKKLNYGTKSK